MNDVKESYHIELVEYATANDISGELAFAWWMPFTLRKRDRIISAVKQRVKKCTPQYLLDG